MGQTGQTGPNRAKWGQTGPNRVKQGQAGPNRVLYPFSLTPFPYLISNISFPSPHHLCPSDSHNIQAQCNFSNHTNCLSNNKNTPMTCPTMGTRPMLEPKRGLTRQNPWQNQRNEISKIGHATNPQQDITTWPWITESSDLRLIMWRGLFWLSLDGFIITSWLCGEYNQGSNILLGCG